MQQYIQYLVWEDVRVWAVNYSLQDEGVITIINVVHVHVHAFLLFCVCLFLVGYLYIYGSFFSPFPFLFLVCSKRELSCMAACNYCGRRFFIGHVQVTNVMTAACTLEKIFLHYSLWYNYYAKGGGNGSTESAYTFSNWVLGV